MCQGSFGEKIRPFISFILSLKMSNTINYISLLTDLSGNMQVFLYWVFELAFNLFYRSFLVFASCISKFTPTLFYTSHNVHIVFSFLILLKTVLYVSVPGFICSSLANNFVCYYARFCNSCCNRCAFWPVRITWSEASISSFRRFFTDHNVTIILAIFLWKRAWVNMLHFN